jgi:hypothetical protein
MPPSHGIREYVAKRIRELVRETRGVSGCEVEKARRANLRPSDLQAVSEAKPPA